MRKFSDREKKAIIEIVRGVAQSHNYVLCNVYNDIFYQKQVEFVAANSAELVFYRQNVANFNMDEMFEVENEIMEVSLLIDYLRENGLIYQIQSTAQNQLNSIGGFDKTGLTPAHMPLDNNISQILLDALNHRIFVGETLKDIVANTFLSVEERLLNEANRQANAANIQADEAIVQTKIVRKQTWLSIFALIFSVISIIIGVLSSIWVAKSITMDVKIDTTQVETITTKMSGIEERINSVNMQLQREDKDDKAKLMIR